MPKFAPGISGNPHGRPKLGLTLAERIRKLGGEDGSVYAGLLHDIATNAKESTRLRIAAAQILIQQGYGDPPQVVDIEVQPTFSAARIRELLDGTGILNETVASVSGETEATSEKRVIAWLNGDIAAS